MGKVVNLREADAFDDTEFEGTGAHWVEHVPAFPDNLEPATEAAIRDYMRNDMGIGKEIPPYVWQDVSRHAMRLYKIGAPEEWSALYIAACCYHWNATGEHMESVALRVRQTFGQARMMGPPDSFAGSEFELETLDDMEKDPDVEWLLDQIIIAGGLFVVHAPEKVGKTFLTIALALSKATGRDFCGLTVKPGRVVYIIAEGNRGAFTRRVKAWIIANSEPGADREALRALVRQNFRRVSKPVLVDNPADVSAFVSAIGWLKQEGDEANGLVIVDTLIRNLEGHVSDPKDMAAFVRGCDLIRTATGATVIPVHHHSNKPGARDMFGSKNLAFAMDGSLHLMPKGDEVFAVPERIRDAEANQTPFVFQIKSVEVPRTVKADGIADMEAPRSAVFHFVNRRELPKRGESIPLGKAAPDDRLFAILETIRNDEPQTWEDLSAAFNGASRATIARVLSKARKAGLLEKDALKLTPKGVDYLDNPFDEEGEGDD